ncbi:MAG: hypothetical protein U0792_21675 [Gemmataceae bacterium]
MLTRVIERFEQIAAAPMPIDPNIDVYSSEEPRALPNPDHRPTSQEPEHARHAARSGNEGVRGWRARRVPGLGLGLGKQGRFHRPSAANSPTNCRRERNSSNAGPTN